MFWEYLKKTEKVGIISVGFLFIMQIIGLMPETRLSNIGCFNKTHSIALIFHTLDILVLTIKLLG